jgi:hypothetical protein
MKARARTAVGTLVLLAAAGGALLYAWYGVEKRGEAEAKQKEAEGRLFAFEPEKVKQLLVEARGGSTLLSREAGGWRIPALGEAADRGAVDPMVERLARLKRKAEVAAAPDAAALASYGLAKPRIRLEATLEDGRKETLALGDRSAFDGSLYARTSSGAAYLVPGDVEYWLDKGTEDLRDHTVLRFEQDQVKGLRVLEGGKVAWAVERQPAKDGAPAAWSLTAPRSAPARAGKVSGALQALSWLRALHFADDAGKRAAELGLAAPSRAFVLLGDGGKELGRIEVGRTVNDGTYVRSSASPRILEVDKGALAGVPASADEVEEKPAPAKAEPAKAADGSAAKAEAKAVGRKPGAAGPGAAPAPASRKD